MGLTSLTVDASVACPALTCVLANAIYTSSAILAWVTRAFVVFCGYNKALQFKDCLYQMGTCKYIFELIMVALPWIIYKAISCQLLLLHNDTYHCKYHRANPQGPLSGAKTSFTTNTLAESGSDAIPLSSVTSTWSPTPMTTMCIPALRAASASLRVRWRALDLPWVRKRDES